MGQGKSLLGLWPDFRGARQSGISCLRSDGRQCAAPPRNTARAGAQTYDHLGGIHSHPPRPPRGSRRLQRIGRKMPGLLVMGAGERLHRSGYRGRTQVLGGGIANEYQPRDDGLVRELRRLPDPAAIQ
jgi:hypothetical protein